VSGLNQPSLERVVEGFARAESIQFERDNGGSLTLEPTRAYGLSLYGTTDRFRVVGGMRLVAQIVVDHHLCRTEFVVERAVFDSPTTARVQLEALFMQAEEHRPRRTAPRYQMRGRALVTARWCQNVTDGVAFEAVAVSLSQDGLVLGTWRALRPGDQVRARVRLHGIALESDLWVEQVQADEREDVLLADCDFLHPTDALRETVQRIVDIHESHDGVSLVDLAEVRQALLVAQGGDAGHDRRRMLRRLA
jgi:hypothetical protein